MENGMFKWRALLMGFLSFVSIKNLVAQSNNMASTKQNITTKALQNDSIVEQQSKPACLPQAEDTTITITLGKMRIKEPGPTIPHKKDTTVTGRF